MEDGVRVTALAGNVQRLDGGAMYGNAPRAVWARWSPPDALNRIELACRCFLIEHGGHRTLLETGVGAFFSPKLRERFGVVESEHVLLSSLAAVGLGEEDIDQVILSHLHFDHAGGLLPAHGEKERLLFPRARYAVGAAHWARAKAPHPRDRASFLPQLNQLLEDSGRLVLVDGASSPALEGPFRFRTTDGHTPGLMLTEVRGPSDRLLFVADLIPGAPWVHLPITMGYDRYPERLIDEKRALYEDWLPDGGWLAFTHDPEIAMARLGQDERGRYRAQEACGPSAVRRLAL